MRIVHIMGYFMPELGYQEFYIAKEHAKMGHEVHVIASDRLYPFQNIQQMFKDAGIKYTGRKRKQATSKVQGMNIHWLPRIIEYNDFILCGKVKETLQKINPDVVYAHESRQGLTTQASWYKKELGFTLVTDQHDFYHKIAGFFKPILRNIEYFCFRKFLIDYNFRQSKKIIAVTNHTKEFLKKTHKIPEKKLELIELGVDTDTYKYKPKEAATLRKKLKIPKDHVVFMFVGTIFPRKNIELLLDAFDELKIADKSTLLIVGEGDPDYMKKIRAHGRNLSSHKSIRFTGFAKREELPAYYSMADVGVWPANNSVSIIEAMACRLPLVIVKWQMPHLVSHKNGYLFPWNNKQKLKECLKNMMKNKASREKMGKNSEKAAKEIYSYRVVAQKFLEVAHE